MRISDVENLEKAARTTMNMTPMIDVVFQLIVVFLCSMKFKTLDQKIDASLPTDCGTRPDPTRLPAYRPVLTVRLQRSGPGQPTRVVLQGSSLGITGEGEALWARLTAATKGILARSRDVVGEIDAGPEVEHGDVVRALDGFVAAGLSDVRFSGTPAARRRP